MNIYLKCLAALLAQFLAAQSREGLNIKVVGFIKYLPSGEDEFGTRWRNKLIAIITRDRAVDTDLRERINKKKLYICQRHFSSEQIITHESRTSLKPGELSTINLPPKSIQFLSYDSLLQE